MKAYRTQRRDRRYRMFINYLLLALGVQHHHKAVKTRDQSPQLKAVYQKQRHRDLLFTGLCEKHFL